MPLCKSLHHPGLMEDTLHGSSLPSSAMTLFSPLSVSCRGYFLCNSRLSVVALLQPLLFAWLTTEGKSAARINSKNNVRQVWPEEAGFTKRTANGH